MGTFTGSTIHWSWLWNITRARTHARTHLNGFINFKSKPFGNVNRTVCRPSCFGCGLPTDASATCPIANCHSRSAQPHWKTSRKEPQYFLASGECTGLNCLKPMLRSHHCQQFFYKYIAFYPLDQSVHTYYLRIVLHVDKLPQGKKPPSNY